MIKASLKNYRQSPRKVRLVADLVRGKSVANALSLLKFTIKRSSDPIAKLISSAAANAKENSGLEADNLFIKDIRVDKGIVIKRFTPRARGSMSAIHKRSSHVMIILEEKPPKEEKNKKADKKTEKVEDKKSKTVKSKTK
ncbi:MAG: 50S ribosomal protein L22 [Candidatus Paceibacterota bacterium]